MYIFKAAVIGAGTMGAQIAQVITYSGLPVLLKDQNPEAVEKGIETIRKIYQGRVEKGKMTPSEVEQKMALVTGTTTYEDFGDVDIVIEAIFEDYAVKRQVFSELDQACPETAILATNTSSIPISALAAATRRPEKVIGMHFFNPAHVMKLVEVIPALATSPETVEDTVVFSESLRKIPVRVQECAGFLVNRLLMPYLNEAALALEEGTASAPQIDEAMAAFGMPMGPFALLDMIGIDVSEKVADILHDAYGPRMIPATILYELVKANRLGVKSGAGFYNYQDSQNGMLDPLLDRIRNERNAQHDAPHNGSHQNGFTPERLLAILINEAVICLQEGVATAADIDVAMLAGTGFPQEKEGPLHLADTWGIDRVLKVLEDSQAALGRRFWPAPMLKRMVAAGQLGRKVGKGFFTYPMEA